MLLKKLTIVTLLVSTVACTNDSTEDLIDNTPVVNVTYTANVKSIIDNNCIMCHANPPENGAPMPLLTYENVKQAIQERGLIDRISREQGADGMMPFGGQRLPQNVIDIIVQWNAEGLNE